MTILSIGTAHVCSNIPNLFAVRARFFHALLCLTHLGGRYHFHGASDLLRILNALDLVADFSATGHRLIRSV